MRSRERQTPTPRITPTCSSRFTCPMCLTVCLDWLDRARETRSGLLVYLKVEPMFDSIRGEPRFAALMQRLAFP